MGFRILVGLVGFGIVAMAGMVIAATGESTDSGGVVALEHPSQDVVSAQERSVVFTPVANEDNAEVAEDGPNPERSGQVKNEIDRDSTTTTTNAVTSATSTPTPTTSAPTPVVTVAPVPASGRGEGTVDLLVNAKSAFDKWTKTPSSSQQKQMRSLYDWMVVYSPYFDSRLSWYPNGLAYIDLYAIYPDKPYDDRANEHPEWILQDASDNRLYVDWGCGGGTCPQWAADVGNPEFRKDFVSRVGQLLKKGYPGVMIDDVNLLWRISNGAGDTVIPVDPRTGKEMTLGDWQRYVVELLEQVRSAYPNARIMHNAIWYADAPGYGSSYVKRQTKAADWIMLERGATDGGLKGGDGKFSLASFMKFSDFAHSTGTNVLFLDETADSIGEQTYNLAVYLLVNNGGDLVSTEEYHRIAPGSVWAGFTADLGDAAGPRYRWNGLWRRDFAKGVVLVNDPGASSKSIDMTGYRGLDGTAVGSLNIGARQAVVLTNP